MILKIDQLTDSLNGSQAAPKNPSEPPLKPFRFAVEPSSFHHQFWDDTVSWIEGWTFGNALSGKKTKTMPFQVS